MVVGISDLTDVVVKLWYISWTESFFGYFIPLISVHFLPLGPGQFVQTSVGMYVRKDSALGYSKRVFFRLIENIEDVRLLHIDHTNQTSRGI